MHVPTCSRYEMHVMNSNSCFLHGRLELHVAIPGEVILACEHSVSHTGRCVIDPSICLFICLFAYICFGFFFLLFSRLKQFSNILFYVHTCVCMGAHMPWHRCRGQRTNLWGSLPSLHQRSNSSGVRFGSKCFYLLSYLCRLLMTLLAYIDYT